MHTRDLLPQSTHLAMFIKWNFGLFSLYGLFEGQKAKKGRKKKTYARRLIIAQFGKKSNKKFFLTNISGPLRPVDPDFAY